jgi:CBS domain-containing membrane protein
MNPIHSPNPPSRRWLDWLGIELNVSSRKDRAIAGIGGFLAILLLIFTSESVLQLPHATALVASMGASAVLLFAVPHGQLSQPWPVVAGHGFSALIGVASARWIGSPALAAACAVGLSIAVMHQLKCIHPPGGATALTAVLGGAPIHELGFDFLWFPVLANTAIILTVAVIFNFAFTWRKYPAALYRPPEPKPGIPTPIPPSRDQVVAALKSLDSFVDITEVDLVRLVQLLNPASPCENGLGTDSYQARAPQRLLAASNDGEL